MSADEFEIDVVKDVQKAVEDLKAGRVVTHEPMPSEAMKQRDAFLGRIYERAHELAIMNEGNVDKAVADAFKEATGS